MKSKFFMCVFSSVILYNISLFAQIPNSGFENWSNGLPESWFALNLPGAQPAVTKSTDAHSGSAAAKVEVITYMTQILPAQLTCGINGNGFGFNQRPKSVSFWYKLNSVGGDLIAITAALNKGTEPIAVAANYYPASGGYIKVSADFFYVSNALPETCLLQIFTMDTASNSSQVHLGSYFIVDDISFDGTATSVISDDILPSQFELKQNYPNPFNPNTTISYSVPAKSQVKITVHNLIGQKVAELVNGVIEAGNHQAIFNAGNLSSGIYFYKIEAGNFISTKKMTLLK